GPVAIPAPGQRSLVRPPFGDAPDGRRTAAPPPRGVGRAPGLGGRGILARRIGAGRGTTGRTPDPGVGAERTGGGLPGRGPGRPRAESTARPARRATRAQGRGGLSGGGRSGARDRRRPSPRGP